MPQFISKFSVEGTKYSLSCSIKDLGANCGLAQLSNVSISCAGKSLTFSEWLAVVDSKAFDEAMTKHHGRYPDSAPPTGFKYSAYVLATNMCCLEYSTGGYLSSINTGTFVALLMQAKQGAVVATPLYDNRAHGGAVGGTGDSLQTCVTWWPESCVGSILSEDVYSRFPDHIFVEAKRKWSWCKEFRQKVQYIYDGLKWPFSNPIPEPEAKPKNATAAATTAVWK